MKSKPEEKNKNADGAASALLKSKLADAVPST
jgi:hypothetical protein